MQLHKLTNYGAAMSFEDQINNFARLRMFGNKYTLKENCLTHRKNKGEADVEHALKKAQNVKRGHGKTEFELDMFELYLKTILKASK